MTSAAPKVLVLCLGNPHRGDDAIGPAVAAALFGCLPGDAELKTRCGDMFALIEDWQGFDALVCVDAVAPMGRPGRIHRIDPRVQDFPAMMAGVSSHAFGLGEAIALARTLGIAPKQIVIYGVEGENFEAGASMSESVAAVITSVTHRVAGDVAVLQEVTFSTSSSKRSLRSSKSS